MRIWIFPVLGVLAGLAMGLGQTGREFFGVTDEFVVRASSAATATSAPAPRAVVVDGPTFRFGVLARNESRVHTFIIRNQGPVPLTLRRIGISCPLCIQTGFAEATIPPGDSTQVAVRYSTRKEVTDFYEHVELQTNDPDQAVLRLEIRGQVTERVSLSARALNLGSLAPSDSPTEAFEVYAFESTALQVVNWELLNPEIRDYFEVNLSSVDVGALDPLPDPLPLAAVRVGVRVKPGLPLGPIHQTIRLTVQTTDRAFLEIPISGTVESDISVFGDSGSFSRKNNLLLLGKVDAKEGAKTVLRVLVKGPLRSDVQLSVESVEPADALRATLGEVKRLENVHLYPLEVEVPAGAKPVIRLGSDPAETGRIVIRTTHPDAKQLNLYVSFATQ
jgi:hypothetical protein